MKKTFAFFALLLLISTSCNTTPKMTALEYNDAIINEQSDIVRVILKFNSNDGTDMAAMDEVRKEIVSQCDTALRKVGALPEFEGSTEFRDAGIALFSFYKDISKKEYSQLIDILAKGDFTEEDLEDLTSIQTAIQERELPLDTRFQNAQKDFAKKNNIQIGGNDLQRQLDEMAN